MKYLVVFLVAYLLGNLAATTSRRFIAYECRQDIARFATEKHIASYYGYEHEDRFEANHTDAFFSHKYLECLVDKVRK